MKKVISAIKKKYDLMPIPMRTAIIYIVCSVIIRGISFIVVPIYTRIVPSQEYGLYAIFQSWETVLSILATLNLWNYVFSRGMLDYEGRRDEFTSSLIGLSGFFTLALFALYFPFRETFGQITGITLPLMGLMFLSFMFMPAYNYWCARQRFEYSVGGYVKTTIIIAASTPIVSILSVIMMKKVGDVSLGKVLVAGKVICSVAVYIVIFVLLLKKSHRLFDKGIWTYALKFNLPLLPHFFSSFVLQQSDRIMIGSICGKSEAAIYSVAYSAAAIMLIVNSAVIDAIIPWTYKKMSEKNYCGIASVGNCALLLMAALNVILAIMAPEVISIMAPREYLQAIYIIPPVAISNVFICMFNLCANVEYYFKETKLVMFASVISASLNIVLNYIFIQHYGFIAAGYTTLVCYMVYALCHCIFMKMALRKHEVYSTIYNMRQLWLIAISSVAVAFIIVIVYDRFIIRVAMALILASVLFVKRKPLINMFLNIKKNKSFEEEK